MLSFLNQELNVQLRECPWEHYQDVLKVLFFLWPVLFQTVILSCCVLKGNAMVGTLRSCLHFNYVHLFLELIELHHLASVGWGCVFDLIYQCTVSFLFFFFFKERTIQCFLCNWYWMLIKVNFFQGMFYFFSLYIETLALNSKTIIYQNWVHNK